MKTGLAIMVKTPGHAPVKTRLAADTSIAFAEEWHRRAADCVAKVSQACPRLCCYWAVAENDAADDPLWHSLPVLLQNAGELGERMARVHTQLMRRHPSAILIGADAPQLTSALLDQAAQWLAHEEPRLVIGPAKDGGFWLFGANRPLPLSAWTTTPYSRSDTEAVFRTAMQGHGEWLELPTLTDLDRLADLKPVVAELSALSQPTTAQLSLVAWLCLCTFTPASTA
ncbi:MAG: hypothetical protein COW59_11940 [Lysobacterales bacterium CG17_big_fil_post_rev_8_21_14_2_50_64_11]|nr:MAG: hypothetical protein COW59_11940 [Xanthomonadales bacterium CG17_big_fil_post_rev_8_21_14_2_50_64_11]PIX60744.1 MAG: hypothetical protein COZ47_05480 [Xanthomonadales bacterium CG_4_10_14_3_um_filter_64_11]